jgi:aminomethyltransferase
MGQFLITGPDAPAQLAAAVTQDAISLRIGRGKYGFILNEDGGVIDDTILFRLDETEYLLIVNAGTTAGDLAVLQNRLNGQTDLQYLGDWGKLDVQGPKAVETLGPLADEALSSLKYFGVARMDVQGRTAIVARSGYTGELGYEIFMPGDGLPALADALVDNDAVKPAGLGARDSLRLEIGYPLYGHELTADITPIDAAMQPFLDLKRDFVGVEALRKQAQNPPLRTLVALKTDQRRRFDAGDAILDSTGRNVGEVTSGAFSPSLGVAIGMGYVERARATTDSELTIHTKRAEIPARVADRPLYKDGTCRTKVN